MKTHISLLAVCFLLASVLMVPQAAHAQGPLVLAAPCTVASLTGGFGYELRGTTYPFGTPPSPLFVASQVGRFYFNGDGTFADKFSNVVDGQSTVRAVSQGTYTISSDCTTGTLVVHGNFQSYVCVHLAVAFGPTPVLLGSLVYGKGLPTLASVVLLADATLSCTDSPAEIFVQKTPEVISTYTGTMAQQ